MDIKPNELELLSGETYAKLYEDGYMSFLCCSSQEEVARALVTFMWEQGYLKSEPVTDQDMFLELMLTIKNAISEGSFIELKEKLLPLRANLAAMTKLVDDALDE